jgi:hypothetical protein
MTDILIRDVSDDVVAAIDANALRAGLSRTDYLRQVLAGVSPCAIVTLDHFKRLAVLCADLSDPEVMASAWS